jgi:tellurite resistance protein
MRTYPTNSPEAAARIVALTMLADGHMSPHELAVWQQHGQALPQPLSRERWHAVVHELCEDLLDSARLAWSDACRIEPATLARLLREVDERGLQQQVLALCVAVAAADDAVNEAETVVLLQAIEQWGLTLPAEAVPS